MNCPVCGDEADCIDEYEEDPENLKPNTLIIYESWECTNEKCGIIFDVEKKVTWDEIEEEK